MKDLIEIVRRVAFAEKTNQYIQLQAIYLQSKQSWIVQEYDCEFNFTKERSIKCEKHEILDFIHDNYKIVSGLPVNVLRSSYGDSTNGGISSKRDLYIIDKSQSLLPSEPEDLRECVTVGDVGSGKIIAKPLYMPQRWYMMGGNFIFSSDCRYKEMTGINYPLPVHDRAES